MTYTFDEQLNYGLVGESRIASWFKRFGYSVLPAYELEQDTGKGPRLFMPTRNVITPDMLVFKKNLTLWIEAKHKETFSKYRIGNYWVTGIDLKHYQDYCIVDDETPFKVFLLFLHEGGRDKHTGEQSPSGLFVGGLTRLRKNESHRSDRWGKSGMVYWNIKQLKKIAETAEL